MDKDQKFIVSIIAVIAMTIVLFSTSRAYFYTKRMTAYVTNGYCENSVMGQSGTVILKCD